MTNDFGALAVVDRCGILFPYRNRGFGRKMLESVLNDVRLINERDINTRISNIALALHEYSGETYLISKLYSCGFMLVDDPRIYDAVRVDESNPSIVKVLIMCAG